MPAQPDKRPTEKRDGHQASAQASQSAATSAPDSSFQVAAPSIALPKGGGAIRGIGEKFAANPITGTGSTAVPIATSPGRAGLGPQFALSYDSGAGNGPFGFGWNLGLPSIMRKTDKGLPQYQDARDSDIFILSGAEDLVPVLTDDGTRWSQVRGVDDIEYQVHRYRPRIEGLFARIERWARQSDGDIHWRSISKDNILTLYGKDADSRIVDPENPSRIFSWLICQTRDGRGNAALYEYKSEDGAGVDLTLAHERNRGDLNDLRRTANRYLKHIRYGNRGSLLDNAGQRPDPLYDTHIHNADWMFELVFDYGEHATDMPKPNDAGQWTLRDDPFSTYRAGFEIRTTRLCQRALMFHHFADEAGVGNYCLVRSTDFAYSHEQDPANARNPVYTFLLSVTQSGYKRDNGGYLKRSLPPVEFEYTQPIVQGTVQDVDAESLKNLPIGVDGAAYQWTDLHGEGIPGILTEQGGAWFYKRNLSPIAEQPVEFAPAELVARKPNLPLAGGAQFMDLAGDGQPDLVMLDGPTLGFYEHDGDEGWQPFRPFTSRINRDMRDPHLKFIDLDGDGHADVLISEDKAFVWHASLAEEGFGPAQRVAQALDEEKGPRLVFADGTQSIYLADLSGDGLTDLVRIRNRDVCYWPNLGYARFGAKVTMDHAPHFDNPDQFDHQRIRLADLDGSGTTDIIYLHRDGVRLYFNQSGNSWSDPHVLRIFARVSDLASIAPTDLLDNGTACLVWSSPLPGDKRRQMRYVDLMGGQKPHLLIKTANNLGAETYVHYAPSTKFYLQDKLAGKPWITKLPFPVHVVERVETFDRISGNRFVTYYAYHHGYFDGAEREFRGFGMVEQWDTEEFAALSESAKFPSGTNIDASSHVPPVLTRTWFHTGVYLGRQSISNFFAGLMDDNDSGEYYREPNLTDAAALLLEDTVLPPGLSLEEEREACRALKGAMLRQEIYALDGTGKEPHPYTVTEQNFTIRALQPQADNRHAVFFTHAREAITFQYERNCVDPLLPADPRIAQALTLEVDDFGNVLKSAAVGYGRRQVDPALSSADQARQAKRLVTCSENAFTNLVDSTDAYRTPLPSESRTYELAGLDLEEGETRLGFDQLLGAIATAVALAYEEPFTANLVQKRLIEHVRTQFRPNDLGAAQDAPLALLPLGRLESLALPGESYKLAFTPGLVAQRFGGKVSDGMLETEGGYVHSQGDANWWLASGRVFLSPGAEDDPVTELAYARQHFFLPHRFRDPFHRTGFETETVVAYDIYDLSVRETRDALGNTVTAVHDYRLLQARLMTDPNGNRAEVAFDALGMVVGTAVMGKPLPAPVEGDSLDDFEADLTEAVSLDHLANPLSDPWAILGHASTRLVYDLFAYLRTRDEVQPQSAVVYTLARETHEADLVAGEQPKIQHSFSYSDGFGREIQKKIQAEPGLLVPGGAEISPRWVGTGWTVFNNKGKPVRQFEPFFTDTHCFEFDVRIGVSPILFYDPLQRVVATLNPNHTWQKVVFDPWRQETSDVNDTLLINPDEDAGDYVRRLNQDEYLPTWHSARIAGAMGVQEQTAAQKTEAHANTPAVVHVDSLGRTFLTIAHNRVSRDGGPIADEFYTTRMVFDIEGNQRDVIDALDRIVEFFFHVPLLIAVRLSKNQQFAEAQRWFHTIFDPTSRSSDKSAQRFWQFKPFFDMYDNTAGHPFDSVYDMLSALAADSDTADSATLELQRQTEEQIAVWRANPFDPHAIAALRPVAYMKTVVMEYLNNLIAWGDYLYAQFTIESINEATLYYILAYQILGDRPVALPELQVAAISYDELGEIDAFSNAVVELETLINVPEVSSSDATPPPLYFCIPNNPTLVQYWDTVEDRLFKIRHCMTIEGVVQQLPLFEPPIDPALLVLARASGVSISAALASLATPAPHYRFVYLMQKAVEYCQVVKGLGSQLLAAYEKQDAEGLSLIRAGHEEGLLNAATELRNLQVDEARENLAALEKSKALVEERIEYYSTLEKRSEKERASINTLSAAETSRKRAGAADVTASIVGNVPNFTIAIKAPIF